MARALAGVLTVVVLGMASFYFAHPLAASLLGALAPGASLASPTSNGALADSVDQVAHGADVYSEHCSTCHGDRG